MRLPVCRTALCSLWLLIAAWGVWAGPRAVGQAVPTFDASNLRQPVHPAGPWLVNAGDDPAYAQPAFDDSQWKVFDDRKAMASLFGGAHPEVVWYRLHVKLGPAQKGFAVQEYFLSSAFEVYADGQRIIKTGEVVPFRPYTSLATLIAPIPEGAVDRGGVLIALRVHVANTEWTGPFGGLYFTNITLGTENVLRDKLWLSVLGGRGIGWVIDLFGLGLGVMALALYQAQRQQKEYLWIFLMTLARVTQNVRDVIQCFHNVPASWDYATLPFDFAFILFTALVFFAFLKLRVNRWMRAYMVVTFAVFGSIFIGTAIGVLPRQLQLVGIFPIFALLYVVIPILLIMHWRKGSREAAILLIPVLFLSIGAWISVVLRALSFLPRMADRTMALLKVINAYPIGPFELSGYSFSYLMFYFSLTLIVVLRASRVSRQQAKLENEMEAARAVQQVIVPEQVETIRGFTVETAYEPAEQVGGDFFQVLPDGAAGLLLIVGDVAGHGLPAAMLVSVLVGAIRATASFTKDPAEILANLNERLVGRTRGSFSTALVARITAEGRVTVANAGHLSPYLDGEEIELVGALPLGVADGVSYDTTTFWLQPGQRLTFYSDGVVEARAASGELFGFERAQAISTVAAGEIVAAAKRFGQEDDITVITVERHALVALAA